MAKLEKKDAEKEMRDLRVELSEIKREHEEEIREMEQEMHDLLIKVSEIQSRKNDLLIYNSNPLKINVVEECWEPEPKLDELYLNSQPTRDQRDDQIELLVKESENKDREILSKNKQIECLAKQLQKITNDLMENEKKLKDLDCNH